MVLSKKGLYMIFFVPNKEQFSFYSKTKSKQFFALDAHFLDLSFIFRIPKCS